MTSTDGGAAGGGTTNGATPLPGRFACQLCGLCIATSESLLGTRDQVHTFSSLYSYSPLDKAKKTVCCPCCDTALGTRGDGGTFLLRRERIVNRAEKLEIVVCSMKSPEIQEMTTALSDAFPHSNITPRVLQKSELRGFEFKAPKANPELVVVVHRNEGRALLTDRNGFYHDVLGSAWQITRGNVLVVLTRTELKGEADLFDEELLKSLSTQGDQPTIGTISTIGRVLTWDKNASAPQSAQLKHICSKAYFREEPTTNQGIPPAWIRAPPKAQANWCMIL